MKLVFGIAFYAVLLYKYVGFFSFLCQNSIMECSRVFQSISKEKRPQICYILVPFRAHVVQFGSTTEIHMPDFGWVMAYPDIFTKIHGYIPLVLVFSQFWI